MDDQQFQQFLTELQDYLKQPKVFVTDIDRARELYYAVAIAEQLFPNADISITSDPLQTGTVFLHMESIDILVRGVREIELFANIISLADNFEIYPMDKDTICFAAAFQGVNKRI